MCALVSLTLPVAIQRVRMAASAYQVDCGNIARRSCCDGNYMLPLAISGVAVCVVEQLPG